MTAKKKQTTKKQAKASGKPSVATSATKAAKTPRGAARTEDAPSPTMIKSEAEAEAVAALLTDLEKDDAKKAAAKRGRKAKTERKSKAPKADKPPKRTSLLDAAAAVLREAKEPLAAKAIVEHVASRGLWSPTKGGKTPHATLYAAMTREIAKNGDASRFAKAERGLFTATSSAGKGE